MITAVRLAHPPLHLIAVCVVGIFKVYCHSNFQVYNTVLLPRVTVLHIRSPELMYLITGSLYPLTDVSPISPQSPFPYPQAPGNHYPMLFL